MDVRADPPPDQIVVWSGNSAEVTRVTFGLDLLQQEGLVFS